MAPRRTQILFWPLYYGVIQGIICLCNCHGCCCVCVCGVVVVGCIVVVCCDVISGGMRSGVVRKCIKDPKFTGKVQNCGTAPFVPEQNPVWVGTGIARAHHGARVGAQVIPEHPNPFVLVSGARDMGMEKQKKQSKPNLWHIFGYFVTNSCAVFSG